MSYALYGLGLVPAVVLAVRAWRGDLGPNPIEWLTHETGQWVLRLLLLTLLATPLARLSKRPEPLRARRALGLLAFTYGCLHLSIYLILDKGLDWADIGPDLAKRRFIWAGFASFLCMVPLALTSSDAAIRRLGPRWKSLHRLVYPAAFLGALHYYLLVKADVRAPLQWTAVFAVLVGWRLFKRYS